MASQDLPGRGIVAVHAHPDDETLTHGGTLALWARAGQPVTIVTCTRGEQGEVIPADLRHLEGDGGRLAAVREQELSNAVAALGVPHQVFLDQIPIEDADTHPRYEDSGMVWVGEGKAGAVDAAPSSFVAAGIEHAATRLAAVIREQQPKFVLTYEPGGGYGHPDHIRAREVAVHAAEIAAGHRDIPGYSAEPWRVPAVLGSVMLEEVLRDARMEVRDHWTTQFAHIARHHEVNPDNPDGDLPSLARGVNDRNGLITVDLAIASVLEARTKAMESHATQIRDVYQLPDAVEQAQQYPYLTGGYALSNNIYAPAVGRDYFLPDPEWDPHPRSVASVDLTPVENQR